MLFKNFIYCLLVCATLILINMCCDQQWEYIILPIGVILGCAYKIFDEDDRQYLMSHGIDPDNCEDWFPDLFLNNDRRYEHTQNKVHYAHNNHASYRPPQNTYIFNENKKTYNHILKKCKRNVKINIEEL